MLYWRSPLHNHPRPTKDINQVDIAPNSHPDKAGNNSVTARIKDDSRTAPSIDEKIQKKRRRDPNKHYISGMFSLPIATLTIVRDI